MPRKKISSATGAITIAANPCTRDQMGHGHSFLEKLHDGLRFRLEPIPVQLLVKRVAIPQCRNSSSTTMPPSTTSKAMSAEATHRT